MLQNIAPSGRSPFGTRASKLVKPQLLKVVKPQRVTPQGEPHADHSNAGMRLAQREKNRWTGFACDALT